MAATLLSAAACGGPAPVREGSGADTLILSVIDSIGVDLGDSAYSFVALEGVAWGPDSSIAVLDMGRACIQVYSRDGIWLRSIGRRGNGPGELQDIGFIAISQDGHMYLAGEGSQLLGLHVYEYATGEWLNSYSLLGPPPTSLEGGAGSSCFFKHLTRDEGNQMEAIAEFGWACPDSVTGGSVWEDVFEFRLDDITTAVEKTWYGYDMAVDYDGRVFIAPRSSEEYRIHGWDASGALLDDITMVIEPVTRTPDEVEAEEMMLRLKANAMGMPPEMPLTIDPNRPMTRGLEIDPEGNLWVLRGTEQAPFFDVYDGYGELIAHARMSSNPPDGATWRFHFGAPGILAYAEDPAAGYQQVYLIEYP